MAGRVGDNEFALFGREIAIGDINRNALLALGGETIHQQGEVNIIALRAMCLAFALQAGELVVIKQLGFIEQAANQCRFAVIHRAASDEAQ